MSFYQYVDKAHLCPNAKSPIALATAPKLHVVIRVGRGVAIDKHISGFIHPESPDFNERFGGISGDGLFEGHRLNSIHYDKAKDTLFIALEGGNPDGWTGISVTLPGGQNFTCPYDTNSGCFTWPGLGDKKFSFTGAAVAIDMTAVI